MADEFWWRTHLELPKDGSRDAITIASGNSAVEFTNTMRAGLPGPVIHPYHAIGACEAWRTYADANPSMNARELLGLQDERSTTESTALADLKECLPYIAVPGDTVQRLCRVNRYLMDAIETVAQQGNQLNVGSRRELLRTAAACLYIVEQFDKEKA